MGRDHLVEMQMIGGGETEACRDRAEIGLGPLARNAGDLEFAAAPQAQSRLRPVDGEPEAAERPRPPSARIEKAEMQARACAYRNKVARRRNPVGACARGTQGLLHCWLEASGICLAVQDRAALFQKIAPMATSERTYTDAEVEERLKKELPHWYLEGGWIRRKYKTNSWKGTLMVINAVGHLAEVAWHHPDITASYAWVEVRLMNHAAKGITDKDFALAKKIEEVVHWQPALEGGPLEGTPADDMRFAYIKHDKPKK